MHLLAHCRTFSPLGEGHSRRAQERDNSLPKISEPAFMKPHPIEFTGIYGYQATRFDGLRVEVVRCEAGRWAIFTYQHCKFLGRETMTDHCRQGLWANDNRPELLNLPFNRALKYAHQFLTGGNEIL